MANLPPYRAAGAEQFELLRTWQFQARPSDCPDFFARHSDKTWDTTSAAGIRNLTCTASNTLMSTELRIFTELNLLVAQAVRLPFQCLPANYRHTWTAPSIMRIPPQFRPGSPSAIIAVAAAPHSDLPARAIQLSRIKQQIKEHQHPIATSLSLATIQRPASDRKGARKKRTRSLWSSFLGRVMSSSPVPRRQIRRSRDRRLRPRRRHRERPVPVLAHAFFWSAPPLFAIGRRETLRGRRGRPLRLPGPRGGKRLPHQLSTATLSSASLRFLATRKRYR